MTIDPLEACDGACQVRSSRPAEESMRAPVPHCLSGLSPGIQPAAAFAKPNAAISVSQSVSLTCPVTASVRWGREGVHKALRSRQWILSGVELLSPRESVESGAWSACLSLLVRTLHMDTAGGGAHRSKRRCPCAPKYLLHLPGHSRSTVG